MLIKTLFTRLSQILGDRADRPRHTVLLEKLLDPPHREALVVREMVACGDEKVTVVGAELESGVGLAVEASDDRQGGTHNF
jgi:hypothetical protein